MVFEPNDRVCLKSAPDRIGRITGNIRPRSGHNRYQVDFGDDLAYIIEGNLEKIEENPDIYDLLENSHYGRLINLRTAITHARLTGRLADVIYSMDASNTEFYPYQFKPVLNPGIQHFLLGIENGHLHFLDLLLDLSSEFHPYDKSDGKQYH